MSFFFPGMSQSSGMSWTSNSKKPAEVEEVAKEAEAAEDEIGEAEEVATERLLLGDDGVVTELSCDVARDASLSTSGVPFFLPRRNIFMIVSAFDRTRRIQLDSTFGKKLEG